MREIPTIYVGYDIRENDAYEILKYSIKKHASGPVNIYPIKQNLLRRIGLYRRVWQLGSSDLPFPLSKKDLQHRDIFDDKPFATDFSFTRFLTPFLHRLEGWALFMDCDMYFRSDPLELFEIYNNPKLPLYCVKHNHQQAKKEKTKMYGNEQYYYDRKNWSSVIMFNCSHEAHKHLTVDDISTKNGIWLHRLEWIEDYARINQISFEDLVGKLPEEWNWLDGHSSQDICPKNVHFTRGGPWFSDWKPIDKKSKFFAEEWLNMQKEI